MSDDPLLAWMDALVDYARDWDATFKAKKYFTQEYWYLFVACYRGALSGRPLTISEAMGEMKSGATNTRIDRIKKAIDDGYLEKQDNKDDDRSSLLIPTAKLSALLAGHFARPAKKAVAALCHGASN
jgi:hypothetical protein